MNIRSLVNRFRYGRPIVVVSGLPRSGTSMMMRMLQSGGMEIMTDNIRTADEDNPRGYFELERAKELDKGGDTAWLREARGKTIKIISALLKSLPKGYRYKVVFLHRNLDEVLASQQKMLERRNADNEVSDDRMKKAFQKHVADVMQFLREQNNVDLLEVTYHEVVKDAPAQAKRINTFLGGRLDVAAMAGAVDGALYRNRKASAGQTK